MATRQTVIPQLHQTAKKVLLEKWEEVLAISDLEAARDPMWGQLIADIINNSGNTYPFVLLGQVLGKASDNGLNALALQDSSTLTGARDVRGLVQRVVVPWNKAIGKPFPGANDDPYVNNPARSKNFGPEMQAKARNKVHYEYLFRIANHIQEAGQQEAERLLRSIQVETRRSLEQNKREYIGPSRASLRDVLKSVETFIGVSSNGVRLQVMCYAILKSISEAFPNFGEIKSYSTNSSDASGERAGDVERRIGGVLDFAVEVKDRTLTLSDVEGSILKARTSNIANLLFVVQAKELMEDEEKIYARAAHEFTRGIDVNITDALQYFESLLVLLSPVQRAKFLKTVHDALHELGAHYKHVHSWIELMKTI